MATFDLACLTVRPGDKLYLFHVVQPDHGDEVLRENEAKYSAECEKLSTTARVDASFTRIYKGKTSVSQHISKFIEEHEVDIVYLASKELTTVAQLQKKDMIGSVASGVAKTSAAHTMIVKNFATTTGMPSASNLKAVKSLARLV